VKNWTVNAKEMNAGDRTAAGLHTRGGERRGRRKGNEINLERNGGRRRWAGVHNNINIKFSIGFCTDKRETARDPCCNGGGQQNIFRTIAPAARS
jgi:hypothetical protein